MSLASGHSSLALAVTFLTALCHAFQITGLSGGVNASTGVRPARQEIDAFSESGPAFDLYILALLQFESVEQSDPLSYYQIAGAFCIHGYPHIPWDGVAGNQTAAGYCVHNTVAFPTWHRTYLALFEQVLWTHAQAIAQQYPEPQRDAYMAAAQTLRIPYWDWVASPALPSVATSPTISVNAPNGSTTVTNPLYQYNFLDGPPVADFLGERLENFTFTVRHWDSNLQQSNQSDADAALLANAPTIHSLIFQMFSQPNFTDFSTVIGQPTWGDSIENIHNGIHDFVGGIVGHMTDLTVSAFDPIFWLHHCNVDRLFAMWQALYPDSWIAPTISPLGTYTQAPGTIVTGRTPLTPFHSDNGTRLFNSDDVRSIRRFGYTYPEIIDWNTTVSALASQVRSEINTLYNPSSSSSSSSRIRSNGQRFVDRRTSIVDKFSHITFDMAEKLRVNSLPIQWSIRIEVPRLAYPDSFIVDFFIGPAPGDPSLWATAPNLIGSYVNLMSSTAKGGSFGATFNPLSHGAVSLTHTLAAGVSRGVIQNLGAECVVPVLTEYLTWRARTTEGQEIDLRRISGLSISVASQTMNLSTRPGGREPEYGPLQTYCDITKNKQGGAW